MCRRALTLSLAAMFALAACDQVPTGAPEGPGVRLSEADQAPTTPADGAPQGESAITSTFDNEVDITTAPGPDGVTGTADDIFFDASWTGPRVFSFPSPTGDLWEALGLRFTLIDGGFAFTNSGGCFGSQRPTPFNNWDGGIRIKFLDPGGNPIGASGVSVEVVNRPVTLQAFASDGTLLATRTLGQFRDFLTVEDVGRIDRVDITGSYWCIASRIRWNSIIIVDLDIKPGSFPNSINPKSMGVVPVAILGSEDFDVTDVDVSTLTFGPAGAIPAHDLTDPLVYADHLQDVNLDGHMDLVSHYPQKETGLMPGDTEACLEGATNGGTPIEGCDSVNVLDPGA